MQSTADRPVSSGDTPRRPAASPQTWSARVEDDGAQSDSSDDADILYGDPLDAGKANSDARQRTPNFFPSLIASPGREFLPQSPSLPNIRRRRTPVHGDDLQYEGQYSDHAGKDTSANDWLSEGPGKRVGYDDLTAIDWVYEYAKERQRLRVLLSTSHGFVGHLKRLWDTSQIWWILILTGIATGLCAASIDVVSDWLGDLKTGICTRGPGGGKFYLNRGFCCWGLDDKSKCTDWHFWGEHLNVRNSRGGIYTLEYLFFLIFSVIFAALASILVHQFATNAKQSGIPEIKTMLGGFVMRKFLSTWTLTIKSLGVCFAVASGLWLGKEGPLVHVACCCANLFLRLFKNLDDNEARKREVLSAAAAAGISVAFGAPVGGVLFSLEQLSFYFPDKTMWQSFVCAMIAAVTLQLFNPFRTGKLVLYQVTYHTGWHAFELIPFVILGIIGGVYGGLFIKLNMRLAEWRRQYRLFKHPVLEVVVVAVLTALINYPNKFMRAQSTELVATLFTECSELPDEGLGLCGRAPAGIVVTALSFAAVLGLCLTSLTFGLQIPAGIILPSMAVGACYGRALGLLIRTWQMSHPDFFIFDTCDPDVPCVIAGTYAIIGAASALAGATRMTVSIVVIMFELTGALTYVLPIMISVLVSKWVGDAFGHRGIYESWIDFNGYPFLDNRVVDMPMPDVPISQIMTRVEDVVVITGTGHTIASLDQLLKNYPNRGFPIITDVKHPVLLGYISRTELAYALRLGMSAPRSLSPNAEAVFVHQADAETTEETQAKLDLRPWMDQTPITLSARSSLQLAADMFLKMGLRYIMFCDKGLLMGILTKKDICSILNNVEGVRGMVDWTEARKQTGVGYGAGTGLPHEEDHEEDRGLLRTLSNNSHDQHRDDGGRR